MPSATTHIGGGMGYLVKNGVIKDTLPHSKVDLAMNVYDKASGEDIRAGLKVVSQKLLGSNLLAKDLLPATPKQSVGNESAA